MKQRTTGSEPYKAVDRSSIGLTDEEVKKVLEAALTQKIASINQANYARAIKNEPKYVVPTAHQLEKALRRELTEQYGWVIDQYNEKQIRLIALYFSGDQEFEKQGLNFSLNKGLLLRGPVGCGKTTLLRVMRQNSFNPFVMRNCRTIADEYAEHGPMVIDKYSWLREVNRREWFGHEYVGEAFDDIGTEDDKKNFGNQLNVMANILLNRYDNQLPGCKTHLTTNLTADQLKAEYGERVTSRMRGMFNIIIFDQKAPDRRK